MSEQELGGLDGSNPLGFLAAVGLLRWLVVHREQVRARLSFREGTWKAVLHDGPPLDELAREIPTHATRCLDRPQLTFSYPRKDGVVRDLKPPPEVFRSWLLELRDQHDTEALSFALGYASERGLDASTGKVIKPTALHFTAGQQQFLAMVRDIAEKLTSEDVVEALVGPWRYARDVKSLSWDATTSRNYALRASNPASETRLGNPGADWLAYQALPLFPVVARRTEALTTATGGSWKFGWFQWPVWSVPTSIDTIASLVVLPGLERWSTTERRLRGVSMVFRCEIGRSDQGGYGTFAPARVATDVSGRD